MIDGKKVPDLISCIIESRCSRLTGTDRTVTSIEIYF